MSEKEKPRSEIDEVREAEMRRGRRPIDLEERKRRSELIRGFQELRTEEELKQVMRALGLRDGSEPFQAALKVWRETRGS